ncbi:hypothetical protein [Streptomyces hawaiiensis]|uniref:Uncharacterized protein n=1 Tax=Streptomyces hawaiiensis TaxID=67305 RepID=A0A6G5RHU4_9ACTN|nr:hypothetical protein [Streptomyces hawaiiensis]QCD57142.1 hypothetical protein CEB94_21545 [Streptomyces hawaiiensis]
MRRSVTPATKVTSPERATPDRNYVGMSPIGDSVVRGPQEHQADGGKELDSIIAADWHTCATDAVLFS